MRRVARDLLELSHEVIAGHVVSPRDGVDAQVRGEVFVDIAQDLADLRVVFERVLLRVGQRRLNALRHGIQPLAVNRITGVAKQEVACELVVVNG